MAPESAVAARIREGIAEHLKRDVSTIRLQDDLRNDLGLDSLGMIELLFKIEETFDLDIPNADLSEMNTIGDVIAHVEKRLETPAAAPTSPTLPDAEDQRQATRP